MLCVARLAGLALAFAAAGSAGAVNLSPSGIGQVLIYPYYTVNAGQQTLLSIVNTSEAGKAVKVRFREAYNAREVLDFNVFLAPEDVWTATVFNLADAGLPGSGAGVFTRDASCMPPALNLYQQLIGAGVSAELHLYADTDHAFNMGQRSERLSDAHWPDRLHDWLSDGGWLIPRNGQPPLGVPAPQQ